MRIVSVGGFSNPPPPGVGGLENPPHTALFIFVATKFGNKIDVIDIDIAEKVSNVAEKVSDVAEKVGDIAEKVSDVAEKVSDVAEKVSNVAEKVGDVAEKVSNVVEILGNSGELPVALQAPNRGGSASVIPSVSRGTCVGGRRANRASRTSS